MKLKKIFAWGATSILIAASAVMPVSAKAPADAVCEVCTVSGCTQTGHHVHDTTTYCGYDHESGYCDGTCDAIKVCSVAGCTETGQHVHDKTTYCGYDHESGYCNGTCNNTTGTCGVSGCTQTGHHNHNAQPTQSTQISSGSSSSSLNGNSGHHGGHHGGHH